MHRRVFWLSNRSWLSVLSLLLLFLTVPSMSVTPAIAQPRSVEDVEQLELAPFVAPQVCKAMLVKQENRVFIQVWAAELLIAKPDSSSPDARRWVYAWTELDKLELEKDIQAFKSSGQKMTEAELVEALKKPTAAACFLRTHKEDPQTPDPLYAKVFRDDVVLLVLDAKYWLQISASNSLPSSSSTPKSLFTGTPVNVTVSLGKQRLARDEQVLSIVIGDLLDHKDSPVEAPMNRSELMYLDTAFFDSSSVGKGIISGDRKGPEWSSIGDLDINELESAADTIGRRAKDVSKHTIATNDQRILTDRRKLDKEWKDYERPVEIYPPGYNASGNICVVFVNVPWSIHSADATYILQKVGSAWVLRYRKFNVYL